MHLHVGTVGTNPKTVAKTHGLMLQIVAMTPLNLSSSVGGVDLTLVGTTAVDSGTAVDDSEESSTGWQVVIPQGGSGPGFWRTGRRSELMTGR